MKVTPSLDRDENSYICRSRYLVTLQWGSGRREMHQFDDADNYGIVEEWCRNYVVDRDVQVVSIHAMLRSEGTDLGDGDDTEPDFYLMELATGVA